jgi:hypothetical protein
MTFNDAPLRKEARAMKGDADKDSRFSLRLPRDLMKEVRHEAAERELSINGTFVEIISEWLESHHAPLPISGDMHRQRRIA